MSARLQRYWYSQYVSAVAYAVFIGIAVVLIALALRLAGAPVFLFVAAPSATLLVPPFLIRKRLTRGWEKLAKEFGSKYPSAFLASLRGARLIGFGIYFVAIALSLVFLRNQSFSGLSLSSTVYVTWTDFTLIEVFFVVSRMTSWAPDAKVALLACLKSDSDPERRPNTSWLDHALAYFNELLRSKKSLVRLARDLSLDALLYNYDLTLRRASIGILKVAAEEDDDAGFIQEIAQLAEKPVPRNIGEADSGEVDREQLG